MIALQWLPADDPVLGDNGYPHETELARIRAWPAEDLPGLFAYIEARWRRESCWNQDRGVYRISTGGWSGNESLIEALRDNPLVWSLTWEESRKGGHHVFKIPKGETDAEDEGPQQQRQPQ